MKIIKPGYKLIFKIEEKMKIDDETVVPVRFINNRLAINSLLRFRHLFSEEVHRVENYELGGIIFIEPDWWDEKIEMRGVWQTLRRRLII